jgi:hypothetical protein
LASLRLTSIQIAALGLLTIGLLTIGLLLSAATAAYAQTAKPDEYKRAIEGAVLEFDSGNWAEARVLFEQAHALRPSARTLRGMGKVSFELKEYVRAQRELNLAQIELRAPLSESQRQEVLGLLLRVEKFIGRLTVRVKPPEARATVILDGARAQGELKLDLGQHELSVQAPGYRSLNRSIAIEGGKTVRLELTLTSLDPVQAATQPAAAAQTELAFAARASPKLAAEVATQPVPATQPTDDRPGSGLLQQWWFWTIVGAVVVGSAATAIALTAPKSEPEPAVAGNTGLSIQVLTWAK